MGYTTEHRGRRPKVFVVQDNFLTQHVLEPTRATRILDIVLSPQKELVDNVEINEPLGSSDHNQMHVTPEVVASKINNMNENKSPGVDGISPKILKKNCRTNWYATCTRV